MTMTDVDPRFERAFAELWRLSGERSAAERAEQAEASCRRELACALERLDPEWRDPAKVKARVRELDLIARPLLDAFTLVFAEMRWVELRGLWASTVDADGDIDVRQAIWEEQYGASMVSALIARLCRLPDANVEDLHSEGGR